MQLRIWSSRIAAPCDCERSDATSPRQRELGKVTRKYLLLSVSSWAMRKLGHLTPLFSNEKTSNEDNTTQQAVEACEPSHPRETHTHTHTHLGGTDPSCVHVARICARGSRSCQCLTHGGLRRGAGRDANQIYCLERWQRAAVERSGQGGAASVGDLSAAEVEHLELREHSSRRRLRTWRRRRHEGSEAPVAEWVVI
eukprot:scaffold38088_cov61-Phaeocystis_antarctica.AAC.2